MFRLSLGGSFMGADLNAGEAKEERCGEELSERPMRSLRIDGGVRLERNRP